MTLKNRIGGYMKIKVNINNEETKYSIKNEPIDLDNLYPKINKNIGQLSVAMAVLWLLGFAMLVAIPLIGVVLIGLSLVLNFIFIIAKFEFQFNNDSSFQSLQILWRYQSCLERYFFYY